MFVGRSPDNVRAIVDFEVAKNYVGSVVIKKEIMICRQAIASNLVIKLNLIWKEKAISHHNKLNLLITLFFPIITYGKRAGKC